MAGNNFDFLIPIVGNIKYKHGMFIIYELINKTTNDVFYVGRTATPLIKRLKTHFHPHKCNIELYNYLIENKHNFYVSVIQYARKGNREKYWTKKRAKRYKLFNKQYILPHHNIGNPYKINLQWYYQHK